MDIRTVCYILHTRYEYEGISVNRIVALIRSTQGERSEAAICKFDPDDINALEALDDHTDTQSADPFRSHPRTRFGPRQNPYHFEKDRPSGGGYYVGIRAIQGHSVAGVMDLLLRVPIYARFQDDFDLIWHATHWGNLPGILDAGLVQGGQVWRARAYTFRGCPAIALFTCLVLALTAMLKSMLITQRCWSGSHDTSRIHPVSLRETQWSEI